MNKPNNSSAFKHLLIFNVFHTKQSCFHSYHHIHFLFLWKFRFSVQFPLSQVNQLVATLEPLFMQCIRCLYGCTVVYIWSTNEIWNGLKQHAKVHRTFIHCNTQKGKHTNNFLLLAKWKQYRHTTIDSQAYGASTFRYGKKMCTRKTQWVKINLFFYPHFSALFFFFLQTWREWCV